MQLTDILALAAQEGMRRHVEKRGGVMLPISVGAMAPGIAHKAIQRAHETERAMDEANNQPFKIAAAAGAGKAVATVGKGIGGMMMGGAVASFGKEMGTSGANLLRDIANKAMEAIGHGGQVAARQAILGDLKRSDSVLAGADDKTLMESYHTMTRFAPVLSTDKNAVRSFLRQSVMSGSGPDFISIKLLADSERAVTGEKSHR